MLQIESAASRGLEGIVGDSPTLRAVLRKVSQVAPVETTVLLTGETGTGKELIARAIHLGSARKDRPLVAINCGAIPSGVVESELFGHEKGAFTGAIQRRVGRFELADRSTLFLDEVGELPLETQVKLLRVLQEQEFERVGSTRGQRVDVRIVAATNRDLETEVAEGRFRADLFYRLNVFPLWIPPLRERPDDIPLLVRHFLAQFQRKFAKPLREVTTASLMRLQEYGWPGNIRELQNVLERACVLATGPVVEVTLPALESRRPAVSSSRRGPELHVVQGGSRGVPHQPEVASSDRGQLVTLEENERAHIRRAMRVTGGRIHGPGGAANVLGINPSTLRSRMQKLGILREAS
jgi:transcriptional regulator with GAF, ATPase, and Fis domain